MSNDIQSVSKNNNVRTSEKAIRLRFVIILYAALTAVNFLFADYIKHIDVLNDEYFYLNTAQNIFCGEGPVIDGLGMGFDKILYSIVIAPLYFIKDAVLRVKMISLVNCLLISSSLFPVWLIARKIELSRNYTFWALVITCVFPELSICMSFMSESLFFPLALFFIYFWTVNEQDPTKKNAVILGITGFLCYFCKASFLAVFAACIGFRIVFPVISYLTRDRSDPVKLKSCYSGKRFVNLAVFSAVFTALSAVLKFTLFNGTESSYQIKSITMFFESYRFWYAMYGLVYNIAGIMISILILPFVYPVLQYKKLGDTVQRLFCFLITVILATAAVVDYTITSYEDYGMSTPRVHIRYLSYCILIICLIFLKSIESSFNGGSKNRPRYWAAVGMSCIIPCMIYRGTATGVPDQALLYFYEDYRGNIGTLELDLPEWLSFMREKRYLWLDGGDPMKINVFALVFGTALFILVIIFHFLFTKKREKTARVIVLSAMIIIMASSSLNARDKWHAMNSSRDDRVSDVININGYFADAADEFNMLYITNYRYGDGTKTINTYLNLGRDQHIVFAEPDSIDLKELAQNGYSVEKTEFTNLYSFDRITYFKYDPIPGFDYILMDRNACLGFNKLSGVEEIPGLNTEEYILYKNLDPETLIIEPDMSLAYSGGLLEIWPHRQLAADVVDVNCIFTDNGLANVNDVSISVNIPVDEKLKTLDFHVELENEFGTYQLFMVRQDGNEILNDAVTGKDEVNFTVDVSDGSASFEIMLPNVILERIVENDERIFGAISCKIKKIEISDRGFENDQS